MNNFEQSCNFSAAYQSYQGEFSWQNLLFNANLQEFSQQISRISCLLIQNKISQTEAMKALDCLYDDFSNSVNLLEIQPDFLS